MLPGLNVYKQATKIIGKSDYIFFADNGRTLDARGYYTTDYASGVDLRDTIQAVPRAIFAELGLDFDKYYIVIYTDNPLLVVERDTSGDQIEYNGRRFQLLDNTDWVEQDGWQGIMAVRLEPEIPPDGGGT